MPASPLKPLRTLLAVTLVGACSPVITNHGHRLDPDVIAEIQPGVTSREEVFRLLGSPSSIGTFDSERWYYISQRTEELSFYQRELTEQDVLAVEFDAAGIVSDLGRRDLAQALAIEPAPERTETLGNELTLLQQLLGNVGRFNTNPEDVGLNRTINRR